MTREFFTPERMHIRPDREDWARYQASKSGQGFRMPGGLKREWRRTEPKPVASDPIVGLRAEMRAGFEGLKMQNERMIRSIFFAAAVVVAVLVLAASAVVIFGGAA